MTKYIWIDPEIYNEENMKYVKQLEEQYSFKFKLFLTTNEAIDYIKEIEFEETKIIISGKLYLEFINSFKINITAICVAPKIIIFTSSERRFLEYNKEYKNIDNKFYNIGGIATIIEEVENFLKNEEPKTDSIFISQSLGKPLSDINLSDANDSFEENISKKIDEAQLIFEYIDKKEKLILPLFFKILIDKVSNDNLEKYTDLLYKEYSEESDRIKKLLKQLITIQNIPIEILSKYFARLYTYNSNFHSDLNADLRINKKDKHLSYIKTLYEGVKLKSLPLSKDNKLYRGSIISNEEIKTIREHLNKKIEGLPASIVFSKSFLSFSKDKEEAEKFLNNDKKIKNVFKALFILEKDDNKGYNLTTHGDIEKISLYPKEKEVLFFPFSSFEIKNLKEIKSGNEICYEIELLYLGKYLEDIEKDEKITMKESEIPDSPFKQYLIEFDLIKKEKIENLNTKELYNSYKKYENDIKNIKPVEIQKKNDDIKIKYLIRQNMIPFPLNNEINLNPFQRLKVEYKLCTEDIDLLNIGCCFSLENNQINRWRITMIGPKNTPYEGGLFKLRATFPDNYPINGPEILFMNKIYHLNVDFKNYLGHICVANLNSWWISGKVKDYPYYTMKQALFDIFCLFYVHDVEGAFRDKKENLYINNRDQYEANARKWTELYASIL